MADHRHILVVDDDPDFVDYVRIVLEAHHYRVSAASSAEEAMAQMRAQCPDLVIADVMMSYVLDGWSLGREMREDRELCHVPIVMVSAIISTTDDPLFPDASQVYHNVFLSKPFAPDRLLTTVSELLPHDEERRGVV